MKTITLRLILGDQLSLDLPTLQDLPAPHDASNDLLLMCEVDAEAQYVRHHKKKIALVFSAMRHFAATLQAKGYPLHYSKIDDPDNRGSLAGEVERILAQHAVDKIIVTEPGEYRLLEAFRGWQARFGIEVEIREDSRFLSSTAEFAAWADGRKQLRMEYFYREMRRKHGVLMDGDQPVGGQWNFDSENRKPPKQGLQVPPAYRAKPDAITREVIDLVQSRYADHFGELAPFHFAVTRKQALVALSQFIDKRLCHFGDYQDAMVQGEPWMYHSHISFYLNLGLLGPMECIRAAESAYDSGAAPLNAVEGFIRQILGWREYVRGIYWLKMPDYESENFLDAKRSLPAFFWSGDTDMNCLHQCITETRENAYAHHIQRLMVLGNFALIAGLDPAEVNDWYMIVYADAYQWVELPNVTGMILFADGGVLGSKPYAASGAYINKMSNYCGNCRHKVKQKTGEDACPFNYLYWSFMTRNRDKLENNPRLAMTYRTLARMDEQRIAAIELDSHAFLEKLNHEKV